MSTTFTRRPPTTTSRGLRFATGGGAACRETSAKPNEDSAQQQLEKNIPAAALDTPFRNSLRFGMVDFQPFASFDFRLAIPDGPTYTPEAARRERTYCFGFES